MDSPHCSGSSQSAVFNDDAAHRMRPHSRGPDVGTVRFYISYLATHSNPLNPRKRRRTDRQKAPSPVPRRGSAKKLPDASKAPSSGQPSFIWTVADPSNYAAAFSVPDNF